MLRNKVGVRVGAGIAGLTLAAALIAPTAFGHASAAPKLIGNPTAGKVVFTTTCGTCHMLKAAKHGRHDRSEPRQGGRSPDRGADHQGDHERRGDDHDQVGRREVPGDDGGVQGPTRAPRDDDQ